MYQKNPLLLEHSGIHSDMMKLVEAITTKYPTSRDLAAALRKFSAEQGGNSKLDKYAMILDKDMDHKQYQRYVTNLIPLRKFRLFLSQFLGSWVIGMLPGIGGAIIGHKILPNKGGATIGGAAGSLVGFPIGMKVGEKIHDKFLSNEYKRLKNMDVDTMLKQN